MLLILTVRRNHLQCALGLFMLAFNAECFIETKMHGQEEFAHSNEHVKSLAVSSTGNVFVATGNTIYQYRNNSISFDDLVSDVSIVEEISIFTLFDYQGNEYLLRCNYTACFVHNTSNIQHVWMTRPYSETSFGHSLGGEFSAHLVFVPCNVTSYCDLYSAISGNRETETFSGRTFTLSKGVFHFDHGEDVKQYIKSKPGTKFEFIYSLYTNGFVYFLRNTLSSDGQREAFISQMCPDDHYFRSYMESRMECNGYTSLLAAQYFQTESKRFLIASFSGSPPKYPGSVLCKFDMASVENYFIEQQKECFKGTNGSFPSWIAEYGSSCSENTQRERITCGYTRFNKRILFGGSLMNANHKDSFLLSKPTEKMTSVLVMPYKPFFIGYVGTDTGYLEKVLFDSSFGNSLTVSRSPVSRNRGVIKSLDLSGDTNHLFYIEGTKTKSHLYTIKTNDCGVHTNCYSCLTDVLSCKWLQHTAVCVSEETHSQELALRNFCSPLVKSISPLKGPTDGGTVLTLTGLMDNPAFYEHTKQEPRVPVSVKVGVQPCNISDDSHFPQRLECITSRISETGYVNITLGINNDITQGNPLQMKRSNGLVYFKHIFVYVDPVVYDDEVGNQSVKLSGNIQLTIQGDNLDIGSRRRVLIGEKECIFTKYDQLDNHRVTCRAPSHNTTGNYTIIYEVDNTRKYGPVITYTPEPQILNIRPNSSIISGGTTLTLSGKNLEGFGRKCQLHLENNNITETNASYCAISYEDDNAIMLCRTPVLHTSHNLSFLAVPYLDNIYGKVETIDTLPIIIVEDPVMVRVDEIHHYQPGTRRSQIKFKGSSLGGIGKEDVTILVGSTKCNVEDVHDDGISCTMNHSLAVKDGLKERVKCDIGYRSYDLGTIAFVIQRPPQQPSTAYNSEHENNYENIFIAGAVIIGLIVLVAMGVGIKKFKNKVSQARDEPYNVYYRRDSNILTLDGLSENHQSDAIQNRQNDYQERSHVCGAQENTDIKETDPLLPVLDDDTREQFEQKNLIISNECLILGEIIGQGHFGCVYKGYLTMPNEKAETIVACKTLHRNNPKDLDVNMFLKEALLMKDFHHHNVMELIGICLGVEKLPLVVLPFMRRGDVLSYIRDVNNKPTVKELVVFGVDIANGMHYLSQLKFVHRDLAARNCMIDENMKVKVADFGLSRDVYEKEYYSSCDKKAQLPVKWMSPESLEFGLFTHKSDVWSFGIVLWELLTRGVNPYPTVDNWDILRYLKEGRRLNKPDFCPDEMHRIMQHCWEWNADERPLFGDLTIRIPDLLRKLERASEKRKQLD